MSEKGDPPGANLAQSSHFTRRWWTIAAIVTTCMLALVPVAALGNLIRQYDATSSPPVTDVTNSDGTHRTVNWIDYPGDAAIDPAQVLAGPSAELASKNGKAMINAIKSAITAEFAYRWTTAGPDRGTQDSSQNGYGGRSILKVLNSPTSNSSGTPTVWADKQRVIAIIAEVTAHYHFSAPILDKNPRLESPKDIRLERGGLTPQTQVYVFGSVSGPTGQWLSFSFADLSKDGTGRLETEARAAGWQTNTISLQYGANALLPAKDRAKFISALKPYADIERPPAISR